MKENRLFVKQKCIQKSRKTMFPSPRRGYEWTLKMFVKYWIINPAAFCFAFVFDPSFDHKFSWPVLHFCERFSWEIPFTSLALYVKDNNYKQHFSPCSKASLVFFYCYFYTMKDCNMCTIWKGCQYVHAVWKKRI
jgi:hypothetical protein